MWQDIARRQGGVIGLSQLRSNGLTDRQIGTVLAHHDLRAAGPKAVYTVAGAPWTRDTALWIAVLATRGVLSHLSAAPSWELPVPDYVGEHVTVNRRISTVAAHGIVVHRLVLTPATITTRLGLPITTASRTVIDCVGVLPLESARALLDRALQIRAVHVADLQRHLRAEPKRRGNGRVRMLLGELSGAAAESERVLHRLLRGGGLTGWQPNLRVRVDGRTYEIDVAFEEARVAIEVDGWAHHVDVPRFRADRTKQNALMLAGWIVLRFTWADLMERPGKLIFDVRTALAIRGHPATSDVAI